jgi:hypothetical protein
MSLDSAGIFSAIQSHAMALGIFDRVNTHEPKNAPGHGLTAAIYFVRLAPVPAGSGLATTAALLVFVVRIYSPMIQEPQDEIDPAILTATDALIAAYSGDVELGGRVRNVDLLGQSGTPLSALAGYLPIDSTTYRTVDITLPLIVNDVWSQSP